MSALLALAQSLGIDPGPLNQTELQEQTCSKAMAEIQHLAAQLDKACEQGCTPAAQEAAGEIERLRTEAGLLLDSREAEAERLDWLLARLPGNVIRDLVGVMSNTRDSGEWRELIDKAAGFKPYNIDHARTGGR